MASAILDNIGTYIKANNLYFNSFLVNGVQLPDGEVIQFTDGQEKKFIGISDSSATAGYIRYNPKISHQPNDRRISSGRSTNGFIKQCRLVAYSFNSSLTSENLMTKLITDLSRLVFTSLDRAPTITIKASNHNYTDVLQEEFKRDVAGYTFVCISIDFDLKYWSTECEISCDESTHVPYNGRNTVDWGNILGNIQNQDDLIALLAAQSSTFDNITGNPEDNEALVAFLDEFYGSPTIGLNQIGVGHPVTGALTSYAGLSYDYGTDTLRLNGLSTVPQFSFARDNINRWSIYTDGSDFLRFYREGRTGQLGEVTMSATGSDISVGIGITSDETYSLVTRKGAKFGTGESIFQPSITGSDMAVKIDRYGIRVDTVANIGTSNSYMFQVGPIKVDANTVYIGTGSGTELRFEGGGNANISHVTSNQNIAFATVSGDFSFSTDFNATSTFRILKDGNLRLDSGGYIYGDTTITSLQLNTAGGSALNYGTSFVSVRNGAIHADISGVRQFEMDAGATRYLNTTVQIGAGTPTSVFSANTLLLIGNSAQILNGIQNTSSTGITGVRYGESDTNWGGFHKHGSALGGWYQGTTIPLANSSVVFSANTSLGDPGNTLVSYAATIYNLIGVSGSNYGTSLGANGFRVDATGNLQTANTHPFEVVTTNGNIKFYNWAGAGVGFAFNQASPSDSSFAIAGTTNNTYLNANSFLRVSIGGIGTGTNIKQVVNSIGTYFGNNVSATAFIDIEGGTTTSAPMRWRAGVAPTGGALLDGTMWFDGADLKMRIAGVTKTFTLV